ncbi:copper resistance protein CopC [Streptomyces sp. NBC_01619]|uniref:copper resistance CopC/CopD family protein n=1 Tax=Streptomyces sp. NBC_01619 TaxID=2975901 RepID=UPI00224E5032|nr:copper resistance protein CopC [Streptomyces sp. NBC_01619]MCX4511914.1 copper resistance protein CopC [Streptomyces sp. NBC_01619]
MTITAPRFGTAPLLRLLLITAALLGTVLAGTASAHAALTGSNPKDGAVLATAPKDVTLTFSEQVALGNDSIRVLDPKSKRVDTGELNNLCSGNIIKYGVTLHAGLLEGTYTVAWQAVSADSHPIAGAFTFSIGAPSKTAVELPKQEAGGGLVGTLYGIARYAAYAGFVVLVGGAAFVLACWPRGANARPVQRLVVQGWVTLTAATLAMLLLRNPYTGSGEVGDAFDLAGLQAVLATKTGAALVSRLLLLGAAALFIAVLFGAYAKRITDADADADADAESDAGTTTGAGGDAQERAKEQKDLSFGLAIGGTVVATGIAATWALSEHASTGIQPGVAMPVDVLHLLAVAAWLGGLVALLVALHRTPAIDRSAVLRFSRVAFWSVVVLAATGLYQSWRQVGSWSALTGTSYGRLLLLKIGLVGVLVGVAWISRRWTARLSETGTDAHADTEAEAEAEAIADTEAVGDAGAGAATTDAPQASDDPVRAAQLARQQAAVATAKRKRIKDADPERAGLRRSVLTEAGVAVVLLAVTTVLTSTEPGRTEEQAARAGGSQASTAVPDRPVDITLPFDTGGTDGKGTARLTLSPGRSGANELHLWVNRPNGRPLDAPEVKVAFTLTAEKIGPLPVVPDRVATGHWSASNLQIPLPGEWRVQITVRTSDIDQSTVEKNVKVG